MAATPRKPPVSKARRREYLNRVLNGEPAEAVAKAARVNKTTLYRWAKAEGIDLSARHGAAPEKTAAATFGAHRAWAARRAELVDAAGAAAERALHGCLTALDDGSYRDAQSAATTFGILVDKAQLLSGGATSRNGALDPRSAVVAGRARVAHLRPVDGAQT